MITAFKIKNFKCFRDLNLPLGNLTLLTGFNAGGKSTATQPLLLLAQAMRSPQGGIIPLNGPFVRLGTVADVLPSDANESRIEVEVTGETTRLVWILGARARDRFLRVEQREQHPISERDASTTPEPDSSENLSRRLNALTYISAVREGASEAFPMPDVGVGEFKHVGIDGRFAAYWYDRFVDSEVPEARRRPNEPASSFRKQLDAWIGALFPGVQVNVQVLPQISLLNLQFRLSEIGAWRRPANVGYGLTYAFPILVALLTADQDQLVIIDSPEAHLHPSAQSEMGRVLAHFAAAGLQVLVETHSDHLLNGARLSIKEGIISHNLVQIHFFTGSTTSGHGVISPSLDQEGRIDEWPTGFFDQSERDLARLAGWE